VEATVSSRDHLLIEECLGGRLDAFGELVLPYQDRIYNTIYRMTGSAEDSAELLQDAMIRAYRGLHSYQGDSSFYTWLYRIAMNVVFSDRRKRRLRLVPTESLGEIDRILPPDRQSPSRGMELDEQRTLIQQALAEVPEPYRAVLVLKDIEGLKYEEIGEILDIPVGTVRSRLHRARSDMRDRLRPLLDAGTIG
jgi:RNA polymerase sigma-70 factor (ECF subfamily)